jgi:hypothetical protein
VTSKGNQTESIYQSIPAVEKTTSGAAAYSISAAMGTAVLSLGLWSLVNQAAGSQVVQLTQALIDQAQWIGMTAIIGAQLDPVYREFAAGFLWTTGAFSSNSCDAPPYSDPVYGEMLARAGLKCISEFLIMLCIYLGFIVLVTLLRLFVVILTKPWCKKCISDGRKTKILQFLRWLQVGFITREHNLLAYGLSFTAVLELMFGSHFGLKLLSVLVICLLIVFGLLMIRKINKPEGQLETKKSTKMKYGAYFQSYNYNKRHFSIAEFYRKVLVGICFMALITMASAQLTVILLFDISLIIGLICLKPYRDGAVQKLNVFTCSIRVVVILLSFILLRSSIAVDPSQRYSVSILMLSLNLLSAVAVLVVIIYTVIKEIQKSLTSAARGGSGDGGANVMTVNSQAEMGQFSAVPFKVSSVPDTQPQTGADSGVLRVRSVPESLNNA